MCRFAIERRRPIARWAWARDVWRRDGVGRPGRVAMRQRGQRSYSRSVLSIGAPASSMMQPWRGSDRGPGCVRSPDRDLGESLPRARHRFVFVAAERRQHTGGSVEAALGPGCPSRRPCPGRRDIDAGEPRKIRSPSGGSAAPESRAGRRRDSACRAGSTRPPAESTRGSMRTSSPKSSQPSRPGRTSASGSSARAAEGTGHDAPSTVRWQWPAEGASGTSSRRLSMSRPGGARASATGKVSSL